MGSATLALFQGNVSASFFFHPLAIPFNLIILMALAWVISDVTQNRFSMIPFLKKKVPRTWIIVTLILILFLWVYNIVRQI
ncbi:MAG: hypothetical protein ACOC0C_00660 [Bacteroidota bacterium]